ncbi:MAG: hypothetical protein UHS49_02190 [Faecalimonas sp.]|nr:hypothetical protein [Faecalimonas sp.]
MKEKKGQNQFSNPAKSAPDVAQITKEKKPQRKAEKKQKRMRRNSKFFVISQGILSLLFLVCLFALGFLPFSYTMAVTLIVVLLFIITWLTQKKKKAGRIWGRILSTIVMLFLLVGSFGMGLANYVLEAVTDAPYEKEKQEFDLMSMSAPTSVASDPFHIYVQDMQGALVFEGAEEAQLLLSINPETKQVLRIVTPDTYYVTIPGVSKGQKDMLSQAAQYGVEASISALSNLYETEIGYYVRLDSAWLQQLRELSFADISFEMVKQLAKDVVHIEERLQTNLSKYEVQEFVKMLVLNDELWRTQNIVAEGTVASHKTFSEPDKTSYVLVPNAEQVKEIVDWIERLEEDEILRDVNPIELK